VKRHYVIFPFRSWFLPACCSRELSWTTLTLGNRFRFSPPLPRSVYIPLASSVRHNCLFFIFFSFSFPMFHARPMFLSTPPPDCGTAPSGALRGLSLGYYCSTSGILCFPYLLKGWITNFSPVFLIPSSLHPPPLRGSFLPFFSRYEPHDSRCFFAFFVLNPMNFVYILPV